jgi:hypothetical protein
MSEPRSRSAEPAYLLRAAPAEKGVEQAVHAARQREAQTP